jgi:hypothetical protein
MNHAIDRDVTDSYANVPELFESLREAQERISAFIITSMVPDEPKRRELGVLAERIPNPIPSSVAVLGEHRARRQS